MVTTCQLNVAQVPVMITPVDERKILRIAVTDEAKRVIRTFAKRFDMTEQGVASRVYVWFGGLPLPVQKWITGLTDANEGAGMREFLVRMEAALNPPVLTESGKAEVTNSPQQRKGAKSLPR